MKVIDKLLILIVIPFIGACEKNTSDYETGSGLYFSVTRGTDIDSTRWEHFPNTYVNFLSIKGDETVCNIKVMSYGEVKNYDRSFVCTIDKDSTTAIDGLNFKLLTNDFVIKAGDYYAYIPVKVLRAENLLKESKIIGLRLSPNEHFQSLMPTWYPIPSIYDKQKFDSQYHAIIISNFVTKPPFWEGRVENGIEIVTWGEFSVRKFNLMCELCDLTYDDFTTANMPTARKTMIKEVMMRHLQNLYNNYPTTTPLTEEDGRLMWVSGCSWTSTIGQPWVPGV